MKGRVVVAVVLVAGLALWLSWDNARHHASDAQIRRAEQKAAIWQARYAEAATQTAHDGTVFVRASARVVTLRDTLRLTDTLMVREYITRTDSALSACDALRRSCLVLGDAADSTINTYRYTTNWYKAEAAKQQRQARAWKIASGVLGGFIVWRSFK